MMCNTVFTDQDPLADWGNKFKYWKFWYAYVYFFASQYDLTLYEFRNEANAWAATPSGSRIGWCAPTRCAKP